MRRAVVATGLALVASAAAAASGSDARDVADNGHLDIAPHLAVLLVSVGACACLASASVSVCAGGCASLKIHARIHTPWRQIGVFERGVSDRLVVPSLVSHILPLAPVVDIFVHTEPHDRHTGAEYEDAVAYIQEVFVSVCVCAGEWACGHHAHTARMRMRPHKHTPLRTRAQVFEAHGLQGAVRGLVVRPAGLARGSYISPHARQARPVTPAPSSQTVSHSP
jgi:hypothetical protein